MSLLGSTWAGCRVLQNAAANLQRWCACCYVINLLINKRQCLHVCHHCLQLHFATLLGRLSLTHLACLLLLSLNSSYHFCRRQTGQTAAVLATSATPLLHCNPLLFRVEFPLTTGLLHLVSITMLLQVTDWADGYFARRLGHTSKLGSYLDPLADKVLVASVVGTMGWNGMLPAWLAVLVVGRDSAQVAGMFVYRLRMFGGRWPGAAAFFDVDAAVPQQQQQQQVCTAHEMQGLDGLAGRAPGSSNSSSSGSGSTGPAAAAASGSAANGLPAIKPLMVSKVNTALVLVLVAGCMTQQWQGLPGQDVLDALEAAVAATTAASAAAYARLHWTGRLLASKA
jgi:cardiolipin synthase